MNGSAQTLHWFSSEKIIMKVPFFQRPYVWKEADWEALLDGINTAPDGCMPFIGSFILQKSEDETYLIIDGQQRITTISIMIKAFVDVFGTKITDEPSKFQLMSFVYYNERVNGRLQTRYKPRLISSHVDSKAFEAVMKSPLEQAELDKVSGLIVDAYRYFCDYFASCKDEDNDAFAIKLLTLNKFFISIILDSPEDDEQRIFDSVNSLGQGLTKADLIKNYLFSRIKERAVAEGEPADVVLKLHEDFWETPFYGVNTRAFWEKEVTSGRIKTNNLEIFLKNFATIKGIYSPSDTGGLDGLYKSYKDRINTLLTFGELKAFLKEMSDYATCFYTYKKEYEEVTDFTIGDILNSTLLILEKTKTTTFDPFVLKTVKNKDADYLDQLAALRKFLVKRILWNGKTKNYNNVCINALKSGNPISYFETYEDDPPLAMNEFPSGLLYMTNADATLILFLTEMIRRNAIGSGFEIGLRYQFTLEHVMPQKWQTKWMTVPCYSKEKDANGDYIKVVNVDDIDNIRKRSVYDIGNTSLLVSKLNTSVSNEPIDIKIEGKPGKEGIRKLTGSLLVTKEVTAIYDVGHKWDERDIYARTEKIFDELNAYFKFR